MHGNLVGKEETIEVAGGGRAGVVGADRGMRRGVGMRVSTVVHRAARTAKECETHLQTPHWTVA